MVATAFTIRHPLLEPIHGGLERRHNGPAFTKNTGKLSRTFPTRIPSDTLLKNVTAWICCGILNLHIQLRGKRRARRLHWLLSDVINAGLRHWCGGERTLSRQIWLWHGKSDLLRDIRTVRNDSITLGNGHR